MGFSRILPRMVDNRTKTIYAGLRSAMHRTVSCYIAIKMEDLEEGDGYDQISDAPFSVEEGAGRSWTYRVVTIPARIRWEGAGIDDAVSGGIIKEGVVTAYVSVDDSSWIAKTQGDAHSYLVVDGHTMKAVAGPQPEGMGAILEHSWTMDQYSTDGLMDMSDGGVTGALG